MPPGTAERKKDNKSQQGHEGCYVGGSVLKCYTQTKKKKKKKEWLKTTIIPSWLTVWRVGSPGWARLGHCPVPWSGCRKSAFQLENREVGRLQDGVPHTRTVPRPGSGRLGSAGTSDLNRPVPGYLTFHLVAWGSRKVHPGWGKR